MVVDVHAHLYPRAFMQAVAAHGPQHGVSLRGDVPPTLCFEGIDFWRYTPAFGDEDPRLREMDAAGVERQAVSLGPPMTDWAPAATSAWPASASAPTCTVDYLLDAGIDKLVTNEYLPQ